MKERIHLMGTPIDNLTMSETLDIIKFAIERKEHIHHTVVNAGKIVSMHSDTQLRESVINADIINADGQAVVWASKLLGTPLKERVAGIDLMSNLVELAFKNQYKIFFLGAKQNVLEELVSRYSIQYSPEIIAGYRNGYFKKEDEKEIALQIDNSNAHMLFVAITSPIKEIFLYENRDTLKNVNFIMGVGGSFDVVAGYVKRAPLWMQRLGLEWLFRVYQEPRRMFKRYLVGNFKFIQLLIKYKLSGKSYTSS
ncbi:WecB/TagA/CpsF family glycosyltransferase [Agriterribacter sp.]|uniref:WecB/TagA/CpsF family glycosyltransferase n=1 Tax=Agriterribacter sp. TaxID=2821509 RepID=UPI002C4EC7F0|nr:WecB/TagA/CpsF family glycosyltransferase [Agriterribacter sp.]HTN08890.1 WecB/TagA/CpsF family glycosyltransferase [Agriterribacter sp.]